MDIPVPEHLTTFLLHSVGLGTLPDQHAKLQQHQAEFQALLGTAREILSSSTLDPFVQGILASLGCKEGTLTLQDDGSMIATGRRVLSLAHLREEALSLGVDISHLGRKVKAIRALLDQVRSGQGQVAPDEVVVHEPRKGFKKTAPALNTQLTQA